eukprot:3435527-Rhodomonas_salina.1
MHTTPYCPTGCQASYSRASCVLRTCCLSCYARALPSPGLTVLRSSVLCMLLRDRYALPGTDAAASSLGGRGQGATR